jgi:Skp family chaperone for outer membrane proteins
MKSFKVYVLIVVLMLAYQSQGQRGLRVGYVDMEYILDQIPEYQQAVNQLDQKAQKWKVEISKKRKEIENLEEQLENERPLLTQALIEEREGEIEYLRDQMLAYKAEKFGVAGDYVTQKRKLVQPIQDQVFNAIQELGKSREYDFIHEMSSDASILYASKRHDISDMVLKLIQRESRQSKATAQTVIEEEGDYKSVKDAKKDKEKAEQRKAEKDAREAERQKQLDERERRRDSIRKARKKKLEERKARLLKKRKEMQRKRDSIRNARENEND